MKLLMSSEQMISINETIDKNIEKIKAAFHGELLKMAGEGKLIAIGYDKLEIIAEHIINKVFFEDK